jgi:hypothetical protein
MGTYLGRQGSDGTGHRMVARGPVGGWRLAARWRALIRGLVLCLVLAGWLALLPARPAQRKGKGGSMHIADVVQGMLGANDIGTLAVAIGQIAAVSTGYGPVSIAGQDQMSIASLASS